MEKITYIVMDYYELDELITKTYGYKFDIVAEQELDNSSLWKTTINKAALDESAHKDLDRFKSTGHTGGWCTHTLMTDMCNQGILEPGNYLIQIYW